MGTSWGDDKLWTANIETISIPTAGGEILYTGVTLPISRTDYYEYVDENIFLLHRTVDPGDTDDSFIEGQVLNAEIHSTSEDEIMLGVDKYWHLVSSPLAITLMEKNLHRFGYELVDDSCVYLENDIWYLLPNDDVERVIGFVANDKSNDGTLVQTRVTSYPIEYHTPTDAMYPMHQVFGARCMTTVSKEDFHVIRNLPHMKTFTAKSIDQTFSFVGPLGKEIQCSFGEVRKEGKCLPRLRFEFIEPLDFLTISEKRDELSLFLKMLRVCYGVRPREENNCALSQWLLNG